MIYNDKLMKIIFDDVLYNDFDRKGVDFEKSNFEDNINYRKVKNNKLFIGSNIKLTVENIIYKYYISNEIKKELHGDVTPKS